MLRNREQLHHHLQQAALELFHQRGYDQTTAAQIAARAGVTERTFFRHFADKREVLFAGADDLRKTLVEKILQAPGAGRPLLLVTAVLSGFNWEALGSRDFQRRRQTVIDANPELVERDLSKHRSIEIAIIDALHQRGVRADIAQLAARVGIQIFLTAYGQWLKAGNKANLPTISEKTMLLLATIVPVGTATPRRTARGRGRKTAEAGP